MRNELSLKAKNGIDFIIAASLIWLAITFIWTLSYSSYNRSIFTFMVGGVMLPLAFLMSKVFKTQWKLKDNPLQPLGMWLNLAQLFYFPFLVFVLIKSPDYFVMTYAIITGAHFFPYAWFYKEPVYGIFAGIISIGALLISLSIPTESIYLIPLFTTVSLGALGVALFISYQSKKKKLSQ